MDRLGLELSLFIRYACAGAVLLLAIAHLEPTALNALPQRLLNSEVWTTLMLFTLGAPVYHLHRALGIPLHHSLLRGLLRLWEMVRRVPPSQSNDPARLLGAYGVRGFVCQTRAYTAVRRGRVFEDRDSLNVLHAANGLMVLIAVALVGASIYAYIHGSAPYAWGRYLWAAGLCLFVSFVASWSLHAREATRMRAAAARRRIQRVLLDEGFLDENWSAAMDQFVDRVREAYDGRLQQVVLYGSRARGTADEESDVDVLVVLKSMDDYWKEVSDLQTMALPICREHDVILSAIPVQADEFQQPKTPLLINSKREGIRVA